jgi:putative (di)nucleoside polyphosphate hydrolase
MFDNSGIYRQGVGAVILNQHNQIFAGQRMTDNTFWQMPQGGLHANENHMVALFREIYEETGIKNIKILGETPPLKYHIPVNYRKNHVIGQEQVWFFVRFLGEDNEINLTMENTPEFKQWKWLEVNSLLSNVIPFKKQLYEQIISNGEKLGLLSC